MGFATDSQSVTLINRNQLDKLLREALYNKSVGCLDSILNGIAHASHHAPFYEIISKRMWKAINSKPSKWLHIQKGLTLLEYLVLNGAEWCIGDVLHHLKDLNNAVKLNKEYSTKTSFLTKKPLAPPHTAFVITEKCKNLINLVSSKDELLKKREQVAMNKNRYIGLGQKNGILETSTLNSPIIAVDYPKSFFSQKKNSVRLMSFEYDGSNKLKQLTPFPPQANNVVMSHYSTSPKKSYNSIDKSALSESFDSDDSSSLSSSSLSSQSDSDSSLDDNNESVTTNNYVSENMNNYNRTNRIPTSYTTPTAYIQSDASTLFSSPMTNYDTLHVPNFNKQSDYFNSNIVTPRDYPQVYSAKSHLQPVHMPLPTNNNSQSGFKQQVYKSPTNASSGSKQYKSSNPFAY